MFHGDTGAKIREKATLNQALDTKGGWLFEWFNETLLAPS